MDKYNKKMSIGIIVRKLERGVLATMSDSKLYIMDPIVAEALATLATAVFNTELGLQKIVLEGDAFKIEQTLKTEGIGAGTPN